MKKLLTFLILLIFIYNLSVGQTDSSTRFDSLEMITFLDGVIETNLKDKNIAGATMALVVDGEIKFLKGYGYSNISERTPVDPSNTLFRIGSISKMFVWTAIMQLVEQGKISLDDDINQYFDEFQIPDTYPEPVTIKHLMSHTPGFEDLLIQLFVKDSTLLKPLEEILKDQIPARVRPPGTIASYSNHGTGMAALIVEKVSGMDFADYVNANITGPLKMNHTSLAQPLPQELKPHMSKGYLYQAGEYKEQPFELVPLAPVGAVSATAADMARFMMMHLQLGQIEGNVILDSATAKLMQSPAHQHDPAVNPMRYGFMDLSQNGQTIICHGGDTFWFHSLMALFPKYDMGLFVSFNSQNGGGAYMDLLETFSDRYFPEKVNKLEPQTAEFLRKFTGTYESNRYPRHDIFKISKMMSLAKITANEHGGLRMEMGENIDQFYFLKDLTFRKAGSSEVIVFKEDNQGQIKHMYLGGLPIIALDRIEGIDSPVNQIMILSISLLIIVLTFFYWTLLFFIKRRLDADTEPMDTIPGSSKLLAWIIMLLVILFYTGLGVIFSNPFEVIYGIPAGFKILLIIPFLVIILTLLMILQTWNILKKGEIRLFSRIWYMLLLFCVLATIWQWNYWNLLGWNY